MAPEPVRVDHEDGLAVVTIDAPPLNLFDDVLQAALVTALDELEHRPPRAVLVRAEGRVVSAGVDIRTFEGIDGPDAATTLFAELVGISRRVADLPCPTVFAAHGLCLTWAFELALACDLIVAAESAFFGLVEATVGLTPAMGGTQRLAERAGTGRARELVLTAGRYDAATLHGWGVVNRVLPDDELAAGARELATSLAAGPTRAHVATKQVLARYLGGGVGAADEWVPAIASELFATQDLRGALASFRSEGHGRASFTGE